MDEDDIYGSILSEPKSFSSNSGYAYTSSNSNLNANESHSNEYSSNGNSSGPNTNSVPTPWLFVSNLTWWTNEDELRSLLGEGLNSRIISIHFIEHKPNGKSKGMAILEFGDVETAEVAKERIEGKEIHGKNCEVGFSRNPPIKSFEKKGGPNMTNNFRPPNYHPNPNQQYQRTRPIEYEVESNQNESGRHVYRDEPQTNNPGQYIDRSSRFSRDHYRDSREHYQRDSRTRSRSPDRRLSSYRH